MNKTGKIIFGLFAFIGIALIIGGLCMVFYARQPGYDQDMLGGGFVVLGMGAVFLLSGGAPLVYFMNKASRHKKLLESGTPIQTQFNRVEMNGSITVNGKSPYNIVSHWQDPVNRNTIWEFRSLNLWYDPEPYIREDKSICVYVDPQDYKNYAMDMSQFPVVKS